MRELDAGALDARAPHDGSIGRDASIERDGGPPDAGPPDAGSALRPPPAMWPWNGYTTGNPRAPDLGMGAHPLRPLFRWAPVEVATHYELEVTDACGGPDPRACTFDTVVVRAIVVATTWRPDAPLPIATEPPVGRRYFWRVRACDASACSAWTETRYLDVGRSAADLDCDGDGDVVAGAFSWSEPERGEGAVLVWYGREGALGSPQVIDNPLDLAGGRFSIALDYAGDVDADGCADLMVGGGIPDHGAAFLFRGRIGGLRDVPDALLEPGAERANSLMGDSIAGAGDVDGDGYADVAVGLPGWREQTGLVLVYRGGPDGLSAEPAWTIPSPLGIATQFTEDLVGSFDADGDGHTDIAAGAWLDRPESTETGRAFLFRGGAGGPDPTPSVTFDPPTGVHGLGWLTSAGDFDCDGWSDLAIGAYGSWGFLYRSGHGALAERDLMTSPRVGLVPDLDADGCDDLIDSHDIPVEVRIVHGGPPPAREETFLLEPETTALGSAEGGRGGAGDVDGDGVGDAVLSTRGYSFRVIYGSRVPGGLRLVVLDPPVTLPDDYNYGYAVARAEMP